MTKLGREGGRPLMLLLLFALTSAAVAEVMLIHEDGEAASWGYWHLPSTFPLTWTQARAACEALPGSMLARVDGWQAEAAVEEYLRAARFTEAVWLANRQTLPEVLEDEQREMNHVGEAGVMLGGDLTMGGEVGVTLRCATYRVGGGIGHELCAEAAVSAALCMQRLSTKRPLLEECPASPHRQWLLVTRLTETTPASEPQQQTTVSVVGLQQCHHHHRRLTPVTCRSKGGWDGPACNSESSQSKHHQGAKKPRRGHRQRDRSGSSRRSPPSHTTDEDNLDYERGPEERDYIASFQQDNARSKRSAEKETKSEEHTTHKASPSAPTAKTTTVTTTIAHQPAHEGHRPEVNDKVVLFITDYKKSNSSSSGKRHDEKQSQNNTSSPQTLPEKAEPRLDDKNSKRSDSKMLDSPIDETINEIEAETSSTTETDEPSPPHHSIKKSLKDDDSPAHNDENGEKETVKHHVTAVKEDSEESSEEEEKEGSKRVQAAATSNDTPIFQVGAGPIFVLGPEDDNETHSQHNEGPHSADSPKRSRSLVFPKDSTASNPNDSIRPSTAKEPSTATPTEPSSTGTNSSGDERKAPATTSSTGTSSSGDGKEAPSKENATASRAETNSTGDEREAPVTTSSTGTNSSADEREASSRETATTSSAETNQTNSSGDEREAPSQDRTTTPSKPIVFPETPNINTPLSPVTANRAETTARPTEAPKPSETKAENAPDVSNADPESTEIVITPEVSVTTTEETGGEEGKTEGEEREKQATSDLPKKPEGGHTELPTTAKPQRPQAENGKNSDSATKTEPEGETNEAQVGNETTNTKVPTTQSSVPLQTTTSQQQGNMGAPLPTTETPQGHGTQLLIAQIFKSIFG